MAQPPPGVTNTATGRQTSEPLTAPFVLSLLGGLLVLGSAGMMVAFAWGTPYYSMMGGYYGMMNGYYGMMQGYGGWFLGFGAIALISGIAILIGAVMIYTRPEKASSWGLLVLIFSVLSLVGMGGFFIGAVLGIIGGVLAMSSRPAVSS